jgi:aspartate aminotransferase
LRLGAELIRAATPDGIVHVSDPTWANHEPLLGTIGLTLERYPYYDPVTRGVAVERMLEHLDRLPSGSVVLLHGSCHNPTGADLLPDQWSAVTEVVVRRGLIPFVDMAYQGLGDDLDADAEGLRRLARHVPQFLLAISCSKNFGLYRERAGALAVVTESATAAAAVATHQARTARRMYSMPPDHGAAVAAHVLGEATLRVAWERELREMVARMKSLRTLLAAQLATRQADRDFSWLARHRGMFSLLGLDAAAIARLRERYHVYLPPDGRINVAGVSEANVDRVADGIVGVMGDA